LYLFDSFERVDGHPARYTESSFEFLNRVDSPRWEQVRSDLEHWFAAFPAPHKADLRGRFRSAAPDQHWPAWWELYMFRLFDRLGYQIDVHPTLKQSRARPDFYVRRGQAAFFLEALTVFSGIVEPGRDATREAWVLDSAALTASQLALWQLEVKPPLLWRNPWAAVPLTAPQPFPEALIATDGAVSYSDSAPGS
jgi:hypothetical protein